MIVDSILSELQHFINRILQPNVLSNQPITSVNQNAKHVKEKRSDLLGDSTIGIFLFNLCLCEVVNDG